MPEIARRARLLALSTTAIALACTRGEPPSSESGVSPSVPRAAVDRSTSAPQSRRLLSLPTSPYRASIATEQGAVYVLTPAAAYRLIPDQAQETLPIPTDADAVLAGESVVYWSSGALWRVRFGGNAQRIADEPHRPQMLAASREAVVWLVQGAGGGELRTLRGRTLQASAHPLSALTLHRGEAWFVEQLAPSEWRLARVNIKTGVAHFGEGKKSRLPAMLAAWRDHVYYYGGLSVGLRETTTDLRVERTLAKGQVCSPLAVFDRIFCARVEGLVELSANGNEVRWIRQNRGHLITSLATDGSLLVWISEAGDDGLEVEMVALDR